MQNIFSETSVFTQFFEVSSSPFSIIFLCIFAMLCLALIAAIYNKDIRNALYKYSILEENESPASFLTWILSIVIVIRVIQVFLVQPFLVDGASMYPTFQDNNLLIVDKTYKYREIKRNDVLVFKFLKDDSPYNGKYFIKRIIGLPGDTVTVSGTSTIIIDKDNKRIDIDQSYVKLPKNVQYAEEKLGEDEYFVMGDNREGSYDSRAWGPIHIDQIAGEPILQLYPLVRTYPGSVK